MLRVNWHWGHNNIGNIARRLPGAMREISLEVAQGVVEDARAVVPVVTGELRDSIVAVEDGDGAVAYTDKEYAAVVEFGGVGRAARPFFMQAAEGAKDDPAMGTLESRL